VPEALRRAGVPPDAIRIVEEHAAAPEGHTLGDFHGISSPNPSSKGVLDRAIALAKETGADVVVATDPDADRLCVATKDASGEWRVLPANETWSVLLDQKLATMQAKGLLPADAVVVRSWVTTEMLDRIAESYGLEAEQVPTGFKWIGELMTRKNVLAGFEESDGMSMGTHTREKCAQLAAVLAAEAAAQAKAQGTTIIGLREALEAKHGRHEARVQDLSFEGIEGREAIGRIKTVLARSPEKVFSEAGTQIEQRYDGTRARLPSGAVVTVRPSGTEPKVKVYVEQIGGAEGRADRTLREIARRIRALA
jgi:phosphoglucomutase